MKTDKLILPRNSITFRVMALIGVLVIVTAVFVGYWHNSIFYRRLVQTQLDELGMNAESARIRIEAKFQEQSESLRFLAATPPIAGLIRASRNGGVDPTDHSSAEQWRNRLQSIVDALKVSRPDYAQIEFISLVKGINNIYSTTPTGANGASASKFINPWVDNPEALFSDNADGVRYSRFMFLTNNLSVNPDKKNIFYEPVVWAALPVRGGKGKPFGYLAINFSLKGILVRYARTSTGNFNIYLLNNEGDLIRIIPKANGHYTFMKESVIESFPNLLPAMTSSSGVLTGLGKDKNTAIGYATINAGGPVSGADLKILLTGDYDSIIALSNTSRSITFIITALILPILILVGIYVSRSITRPLHNLVSAIQAFTQGNPNVKLPLSARDETGILARSFEAMRIGISERTSLLEENAIRHRTILSTMADGLITIDEHGYIQTFNRAAERIFGYKEDQVNGRNVSILMPELYALSHDNHIRRYLKSGNSRILGNIIERQGLRSDGVVFPMEISINEIKVGKKISFIGIVRDITERKEAEQDLLNSEAQLREAQRIARLGFWEEDLASHTVFWSDEIYNILELSRDEFVPSRDSIYHLIHPDDLEDYKRTFQRAFEENIPINYEFRFQTPGGRLLYLHIRGEVRRDVKGKPVQLFGTTLDITQSRLAQQAILRYKKFVETSQDSVSFFQRDYIFQDVNQRFLDRYGLNRHEVIGHSPFELEGAEDFKSVLKPQFDKGFEGDSVRFQTWLPTKAEGTRFLDINISPLSGDHDSVEGIIISARDITELKLAEEGLRDSESRSAEAQGIARLGFWEVDLVTNDAFWSDGMYTITGASKESFHASAESFLNIVHPSDREMLESRINTPKSGADALQNLEFRILTPDGMERHMLMRAGLSKDAAGRPVRLLGTMMDITEKVIAEREIRRYRDIINATQDIMLFVDRDFRFLAVNREFLHCYNLQAVDVIGRHSAEILGAEQFEKISKPFLERALHGETVEHQHWFKYPDRGSRYVHASYNPYHEDDGSVGGVVISVRDVTENKHYEMELQEAKVRAEEAALTKARFLANMSHELRTPLNAIIGYSEILHEKAQEQGDQEDASDLEKIHTSGEHLLSLVNNILDLSKIEAGKMALVHESVNLGDIIESVTSTFIPMLKAKHNHLIVNIDDDVDMMITDPVKLKQCLYNLLSNAAKFTDHGTITLRARKSRDKTDSWMIFEVRDTGIGINEDKIKGIFDAFDRADLEHSELYGGTGLGLAIVKEIAFMMGGEISVSSNPGHGTIFTLQLPTDVAVGAGHGAAQGESIKKIIKAVDRESGSPVVLVIDDDPESIGILRWNLEKGGYQVVTADNGDFGMKLARELKPAAIILDVQMPKPDGWDVLTELKTDRNMQHVPIIMCTVVDNAGKGLALGASDYIVKPVNRSLLLKVMKKYCTSTVCKILVVDDDEASRKMLKRTMVMAGWDVTTARSGRDALDYLGSGENRLPDAILLDLLMPGMDGFEVVEIIKTNPLWSSIPILIMTAKDLTNEDYQRLNGSVAGLMEKGACSSEHLLDRVNLLLASTWYN